MNPYQMLDECLEQPVMPPTTLPDPDVPRRNRRSICVALLLCWGLAWLSPGFSQAQVDPGVHTLHQGEAIVGVIMVPPRERGTCNYHEYWFLFDDYRYPSAEDPVSTTIRSEERLDPEVLLRMNEGRGHWVVVEAFEDREGCG